jgi:arsenate reductase (thioredoxin)
MAEAFMKQIGGEKFQVESAGLEPGKLNPLAIKVMSEAGIDISKNPTKSVFDFFKQGKLFNYVVTVCDAKNSQRCPVFPGLSKRIAWDFEDPSSFTGSEEDKLAQTRSVRDKIKMAVEKLVTEIG